MKYLLKNGTVVSGEKTVKADELIEEKNHKSGQRFT